MVFGKSDLIYWFFYPCFIFSSFVKSYRPSSVNSMRVSSLKIKKQSNSRKAVFSVASSVPQIHLTLAQHKCFKNIPMHSRSRRKFNFREEIGSEAKASTGGTHPGQRVRARGKHMHYFAFFTWGPLILFDINLLPQIKWQRLLLHAVRMAFPFL